METSKKCQMTRDCSVQIGCMKKIVLFLPPYSGPLLGPPAGLLCLAAPLRDAGYTVEIIDGALDPDYLAAIENQTSNSLCFGVSLLTGPMIQGAIAAARLVKRLRPDLPVVFGGWHPTLLAGQTLREPFVDVVVRRQGELTFLETVRQIEKGEKLAGVLGCSYKENGEIHHNADRPPAPLNSLPSPAYDLIDFDAYERAGGGRKLPYA